MPMQHHHSTFHRVHHHRQWGLYERQRHGWSVLSWHRTHMSALHALHMARSHNRHRFLTIHQA